MSEVQLSVRDSATRRVLVVVLLTFLAGVSSARAQDVDSLLEEGFYLEVARCNPRGALKVYTRALESPDLGPRIKARLRLRIGICYDALGQERQAREQFEIVKNRFSADLKSVRAARRYLGSVVADEPSRFMPKDMLFYVELVKPGDELVNLADALQGTPFENPVDSSRARGSVSDAGDDRDGASRESATAPTNVDWVAAYLNRSFFKEVSKIRGIAFGIPAGGDPSIDHVGVASLGGSDVLPGIVTSVLTILKLPRVGFVRGLPVYRLESQEESSSRGPVYLAFGDDVLVWGRPRSQVEDAVERFFSRGPSLASNPDFREAGAQRPGALLFAYLGAGWLTALTERATPEDRVFLDSLRPVLDLDRLGPISARITSTELSDSLSATIDVNLRDGPAGSFWSAFSTPALDPAVLRPIPDNSAGFLALRLDGATDRWQTIKKALHTVADSVSDRHAGALHALSAVIATQLETHPGKELIADLRSLVIGVIQAPILAPSQALYFVAEFEDADVGEKTVREVLLRISRRFAKRSEKGIREQGKVFQSESRKVDGTDYEIHWLEPLQAMRPAYVRIGDHFVVSLSHATLVDAVRAAARPDAEIEKSVPSRAAKVLYLRPETMLRMTSRQEIRENPSLLFLSHVKRALIYTRESSDGLSLELKMPDLTPTLRAVLTSAAAIIANEAQPKGEPEKPGEEGSEKQEEQEEQKERKEEK